jgi:hypothetical protein
MKAGVIRPLGIMADRRALGFDEVPTFEEQGVEWSLGGWRGLGLPRSTPSEIQHTYISILERIANGETLVAGSSFPDLMKRQGFDVSWVPPNQFRDYLDLNDGKLGSLLTEGNFLDLASGPVDPYDFPIILSVALAAAASALFLLGYRTETSSINIRSSFAPQRLCRMTEAILTVVLFGLLCESLGFVVTSAGVLFFLLWRMGTSVGRSAVITLILVPVVYQLFAKILRVPFPQGLVGW